MIVSNWISFFLLAITVLTLLEPVRGFISTLAGSIENGDGTAIQMRFGSLWQASFLPAVPSKLKEKIQENLKASFLPSDQLVTDKVEKGPMTWATRSVSVFLPLRTPPFRRRAA